MLEKPLSSRLAHFQAHVGKSITESGSPSAYSRWLNGTIEAVERGKITLKLHVRPEMTNPMGTLHGGVSAGIADDIMGIAVASLDYPYFFTTINLQVDYLAPAVTHDYVIAKGWIEKEGKKIIYALCEITNLQGRVLVRASSNLLSLKPD